MHHDGGLHLGAGVLDRVGQPAQHPLEQRLGVAVARAHVAQQIHQAFTDASGGRGGPAGPQVALDVGIEAGRVKADVLHPGDLPVGVVGPFAVDEASHADVLHVGQRQQAMLLVVKDGAALAVDQGIALKQLVHRLDGPQRVLGRRPRPPGPSCRRFARAPSQCREAGLDLHPHHMQAFQGVEVVEVRQLGALGVKGSLARSRVGKDRDHEGAAHFHGGGARTGDTGVAGREAVIVSADQQPR